VAFWAQHGGIYWVPNAPTDRINVAQPVAEKQILYLFVAVGRTTRMRSPKTSRPRERHRELDFARPSRGTSAP
jgi:hypothetical protein